MRSGVLAQIPSKLSARLVALSIVSADRIGAIAPTIPRLTGRTSHAFIDVVVSRRDRQSCRTRRDTLSLKNASFIDEFSGSRISPMALRLLTARAWPVVRQAALTSESGKDWR
jgi:hypothetical protein